MFRISLLFMGILCSVCCAGVGSDGVFVSFDNENLFDVQWRQLSGDWQVRDGKLRCDSLDKESYIFFGDEKWENYIVEADITFLEAANETRWAAVLFRCKKDGTKPWSQITIRKQSSKWNGCEFAVRNGNGWSVRRTGPAASDSELNKSRKIKFMVKDNDVKAFVDGKLVFESQFCVDRKNGCVGFGVSRCNVEFDNLRISQLPSYTSKKTSKIENNDFLIVAHRGYSHKYPENTCASIRGGISAGANGIEFDIYRCKSGEIVLLHDGTVDRTTNGKGKIAELTLDQIRKLDAGGWKSEEFAGEPIPTLDEALREFENNGATAVVEIKSADVDAGLLCQTIKSQDVKAAVISFNPDKITEIKAVDPTVPCAFLVGKIPEGKDAAKWMVAKAKELGCEILDVNFYLLTPQVISELHKNGIEVWAWTVNEEAVMQALIDWDIDGITTDCPVKCAGLRN